MSVDGGAALRNECAEEIDGVHVYRRIVMVQCDEGGDKASRCEYCAFERRLDAPFKDRCLPSHRNASCCTCLPFSLSLLLSRYRHQVRLTPDLLIPSPQLELEPGYRLGPWSRPPELIIYSSPLDLLARSYTRTHFPNPGLVITRNRGGAERRERAGW